MNIIDAIKLKDIPYDDINNELKVRFKEFKNIGIDINSMSFDKYSTYSSMFMNFNYLFNFEHLDKDHPILVYINMIAYYIMPYKHELRFERFSVPYYLSSSLQPEERFSTELELSISYNNIVQKYKSFGLSFEEFKDLIQVLTFNKQNKCLLGTIVLDADINKYTANGEVFDKPCTKTLEMVKNVLGMIV